MALVQADPRTKEAKEMVSKSYRSPNSSEELMQARYLQQLVMKEYGVSNVGFLWGFLPIPFSFGFFRLINGMSSIPVPSMETGGFLWFSNLTVADPYYILPLLSVGFLGLTMRVSISLILSYG
jgi:YidC/Oxa1 family membrane protein insertase